MAKAYAVGKALHLAVLLIAVLKNSLLAALLTVVMKLPGYGCQLSCERISCTKGGRLAFHQVLAGKLCFAFTILSFDLGVAVTEINTKKV